MFARRFLRQLYGQAIGGLRPFEFPIIAKRRNIREFPAGDLRRIIRKRFDRGAARFGPGSDKRVKGVGLGGEANVLGYVGRRRAAPAASCGGAGRSGRAFVVNLTWLRGVGDGEFYTFKLSYQQVGQTLTICFGSIDYKRACCGNESVLIDFALKSVGFLNSFQF